MPVCKYCGSEMDYHPERPNDEWECPDRCPFEIAAKKVQEYEDARTPEEIEAEIDAMDEANADLLSPKSTHCWVCQEKVERTEETRDGPYGNFCVDGHSLRNHHYYGEGAPGDKGKKHRI